jgi:hypothetical protein
MARKGQGIEIVSGWQAEWPYPLKVWPQQFEALQGDLTRRLRNGGKLVHTHESAT